MIDAVWKVRYTIHQWEGVLDLYKSACELEIQHHRS